MEAISYGWAKFQKSPGGILVPMLVVLVIVIAVQIVLQLLLGATLLGTHDCTRTVFGVEVDNVQCGPGLFRSLIGAAILAGIGSFVAQIFFAGLIKSALGIVDGQEPLDVGGVLSFASKPAVVTTALFLALLSAVGTFFFYFPSVIIGFLTMFTMFFVVDQEKSGIEAITASVSFVVNKIGETILFALLGFVTVLAGAIACGIGLLVAVPVALVGAAYTFRMLHGQPVSPKA